MVLSKLNKKINYVELKKINNEDLNRETDVYEIKIKSVLVDITIGRQDNSFIEDGIIFFPIYLIKYNMKSLQIGVFEMAASEIIKNTEDIESFEKPLLYSFVTKDFLEKLRLDPNKLSDVKASFESEKADSLEKKSEKSEKPEKESRESKESKSKESKESDKSEIEAESISIHDIRKPYFSTVSKNILSPLKEESRETSKEIRGQFEKSDADWVQLFFKNNNYSLKDNDGGGDCFFYAIRDAFLGIGQETSVAQLREILVSNATEEKFHYYKELYTEYSQNATELKEKAKRLKINYEEVQEKMRDEIDKTNKVALLKQGKQIKEERNATVEEYNALQTLIRDVKFIHNVPDFKHFKSKLRTYHYFADSWSIGIIEKALNIKCIILSSDYYEAGDMESVVNCAVTDVSQLIDTETDIENFYEPDYYVILDHTGTHYKLILYKDRRIFTFREIPYDLKQIILNKCMERNTIFNYIPDFIQMKSAKGKTNPDKIQQLCDARLYDLFTDNIEFVYYSKSRDGIPGKSNGETIPDDEIKNFLSLNKIPNWRKKLSNDWIEPFTYDNHKWASVSHLYEASKYKSDPRKYIQYSLDSGSELSKNINLKKEGKIDKDFNKNKVLQEALLAKWSHPELKELLLATKKAKLSEFKRGEEPEPSCILMNVREKLRR